MTDHYLNLVRTAAKRALSVRISQKIGIDSPCDVYELIAGFGLDLQFVDIPSLEGMYLNEPESKRICVSALRPVGRQKYTAAHELGHHVYDHGTQIDQVGAPDKCAKTPDEEILADAFARFLLMPARAVLASFRVRGVDPTNPKPQDVFRSAEWLGVGYQTLLYHMQLSVDLLSDSRRRTLAKWKVRTLKAQLAKVPGEGDVWQLDRYWDGQRLHAQIGDTVVGIDLERMAQFPQPQVVQPNPTLEEVKLVGVGEGCLPVGADGLTRVSISRAKYVGFYEYRYLAEPTDAGN